ncbi:MAG: gliding motility-associated C-terminal domain-containing protein [Flavobacteriales bacterium]|nr:gliding motility-associated C-terminal domain-containing protein [Flavobacteriales bacterium]
MKNKKIYIRFLGTLLFFSLNSIGQTVNQGVFTNIGVSGSVAEINNLASGTLTNDGDLYVYNHYNNDGVVTFTTGTTTGMTRMRGLLGSQNISGSNAMQWFDCEFDNNLVQPAFHLSNEVSVSGTADFFQGIVDNDNFGGLMVFENGANHFNVDDDSFVDGFVRKNGDEVFRFPIGDGSQYRYASISEPNTTTDAFTGKYFFEDSNVLYPHTNVDSNITLIDNAEYWTIEKTAGNSNVFLTLTWDEDTTPTAIYTTPYEEIHIVRWDVTLNKWVDEGGIADASTKEVTTVINPLTDYGVFTLARVRILLPCNGNGVVVHNLVSANDDTFNDVFTIDGIEECPNNRVEIYNRWGVKVFETTAYNSVGNVFKGFSDARATYKDKEKLPDGTYFYFVEITDEATDSTSKFSGYILLN